MSRTYQARVNGIVLTAVVMSRPAALGLAGSYSYFGEASAAPTQMKDWFLVVLCGGGSGSLDAGFSGLLVAIIGVTSGGATLGTGYEPTRSAVEGHALPSLFFADKLMASFCPCCQAYRVVSSRHR